MPEKVTKRVFSDEKSGTTSSTRHLYCYSMVTGRYLYRSLAINSISLIKSGIVVHIIPDKANLSICCPSPSNRLYCDHYNVITLTYKIVYLDNKLVIYTVTMHGCNYNISLVM